MANKKFFIKVGDTVKVISGSYKNQVGTVLKIYKKTGKIIVENINIRYKHIKPKNKNELGQIKQIEMPIHHSNVKLN